MRIGIVGGGNMAQALVAGIGRAMPHARFAVVEPSDATRARIAALPRVDAIAAAGDAPSGCDAVVLAVKPQQMREAVRGSAAWIADALVVSIAAGVRTAAIARWLARAGVERGGAIVRAMPNTPALIGQGVSGLFAAPTVDAFARGVAERLLATVGDTVWVDDEALLDAVTAVSGSGPAYLFAWIEALQRGGEAVGLGPDVARRLAVGTAVGASRLAAESGEPLAELRERVTSKGGTTAAALARMDERGVADGIVDGVRAAAARSRALGDALDSDDDDDG